MSGSEPVLVVVGDWTARGGLQRQLRGVLAEWPDGAVTVLTWHRGWLPKRNGNVVSVPALHRWSSGRESRLNAAVAIITGVAAAVALRRSWRVVYAAGLHPEGSVAWIAAEVLRRRAVLATWLTGPLGNVARFRTSSVPLIRRVVTGADGLIVDTGEAQEELLSLGVIPERVHVVPGGVDLSYWRSPSADEKALARRQLGVADTGSVVVCCCRLDLRQKRVDVLLDAWGRVLRPGWQLVIAGDGPDRESVAAAALKVDASVRGWVDDVRSVWWAADAFAFPTDAETTGLSLVEAAACGLTGVASSIRTFRDRAPAGVVLADNRTDAWVSALRRVIDDGPAGRHASGEAARGWAAREHDVRRTAAALASVLASG